MNKKFEFEFEFEHVGYVFKSRPEHGQLVVSLTTPSGVTHTKIVGNLEERVFHKWFDLLEFPLNLVEALQ
jgi:hypothetical protein